MFFAYCNSFGFMESRDIVHDWLNLSDMRYITSVFCNENSDIHL